jgi:hypothetical protein
MGFRTRTGAGVGKQAMAMLRIYDLYDTARQEPVVDLRHFLRVLAPLSVQARWTVSAVSSAGPGAHEWFEATGEGGEELAALAAESASVSGAVLAALAEATDRVIWGQFVGHLPHEADDAWIIIRAVDSTFYEVTTRDDTAIGKIKAAFRDVRTVDAPIV